MSNRRFVENISFKNNEKWFMVLSKANVRHMVRSGIADAVESFDDKYKFITWFTVVIPRLSKALMTKTGRENFFNLPKMVVPTVAHSSMAKKLLCLIIFWTGND